MIPKVEFRYSDVYDRCSRNSSDVQSYLRDRNQAYPSKKEIIDYMKKLEKLWRKQEEKTFKEISRISKLKWKEARIICYVIGCGIPFSEPLTIIYGKNTERSINTLVHELIHQLIQVQNPEKYMNWHEDVIKKYSKETILTKNHILLSAIHWKILEKFSGEGAVEKEIKKYEKHPDYKKAWEIVEKEGADNTIKLFHTKIK